MLPLRPEPCPPPAGPDEISPGLVNEAQAYLECLSRRHAPSRLQAEAWEQMYRLCGPLIRSFVLACRVPRADLGDCLQDVWAELVRALRRFRYDPRRGRFSSWLYALARSKAINLIRRRARRAPGRPRGQAGAGPGDAAGDPAAAWDRQDLREAVQRTLAELRRRVSPGSYRVLHLRWMEGRSVAEIAATLGLSPQQVRFRHHRMKHKFQVLFIIRHPDWLPRGG